LVKVARAGVYDCQGRGRRRRADSNPAGRVERVRATERPGRGADCALRPLRARGPLSACDALSSLYALRPLRACSTRTPLRPLRAREALDSLTALCPLRALHTLRPGRTRVAGERVEGIRHGVEQLSRGEQREVAGPRRAAGLDLQVPVLSGELGAEVQVDSK